MTNVLIALSHYLGNSFGLSIIVLTLIINAVMYPLTLKQMKATKAMQDMQPKLAELQKKHAKDAKMLASEQMRLYRESGVSPAGCLLPTLLQTPIWIALYQGIRGVMAVTPESFLNLAKNLYAWPVVFAAMPLNVHFLWLNLGSSDYLLAILVGGSMWLQQKMTTQTSTDPKMAQQAQLTQVMMPIMFGIFSISVPSGLALYWVVNAVVRIGMQYFFSGWGGLKTLPAQIKALIPSAKNQQPKLKK
jgi:YidC/Oxa1 family membrane protein insertase